MSEARLRRLERATAALVNQSRERRLHELFVLLRTGVATPQNVIAMTPDIVSDMRCTIVENVACLRGRRARREPVRAHFLSSIATVLVATPPSEEPTAYITGAVARHWDTVWPAPSGHLKPGYGGQLRFRLTPFVLAALRSPTAPDLRQQVADGHLFAGSVNESPFRLETFDDEDLVMLKNDDDQYCFVDEYGVEHLSPPLAAHTSSEAPASNRMDIATLLKRL